MGFSMEGSSKENNRSDPFDVSFERLNQMSPAELEEEKIGRASCRERV